MTTRDEIIELAVEAGLDDWFWLNPDDPDFPDEMKVIEAFFHAAQKKAYERAAFHCPEVTAFVSQWP